MQLKPDVEVIFEFVGYRKNNLYEGYRPAHLIYEDCLTTGLHSYYNLENNIKGELKGTITFVSPEDYPACLWIGKKITMYEGKNVVGYATITNIFNPILCKFEKEQGYSRSAINAQLNEMIKQNKALGRKSCMSKIVAPRHILDYCSINDEGDKLFQKLKDMYEGEYSYVYKVTCKCNNNKFMVYKDSHPTVIVECCACKRRIIVYNLSFYPSATKLSKEYTMHCVSDSATEVYVNYEYSDEYKYEDDVDFDLNDIVWAKVFIKKGDSINKILDDETS